MAGANGDELIPAPIPIVRCRELLGDEADDLCDEEIDRIRRHAQAMAHLLLEIASCRDLHA
jgi:hypothetical protein